MNAIVGQNTPWARAEDILVSVVIVTWNVAADLSECLLSLGAAGKVLDRGVEIIVVDNASKDHTLSMLRSRFPDVQVVANPDNRGFSAANNQGIELARGRYILVLNPDTVVMPDTLQQCVGHMEAHPEVGLLGCKIVYPDGSIQYECARNFPDLKTSLLDSLYLHMVFPKSRVFGRSLMTYWDHNDSRAVPCILGAFMLFRRQVLDEVGFFDTTVPMYLDDIDLCYRVGQTRWQTYYLASAQIIHKGGRSEAQTNRSRDMLGARARNAFFLKHFGVRTALAFRTIMLVRGVFRLVVACSTWPIRYLARPHDNFMGRIRVMPQINLLIWGFTYRHEHDKALISIKRQPTSEHRSDHL